MERTIGFDFGTHQTKICVEEKDNTGTSYRFFPFADKKGNVSYLLPSVVRINANNTLSYGFIDNQPGKIVRYFKQATYCTGEFTWDNPIRADYFSIWYIAYILFHIESEYGVEFATNMGVPTDTASLDKNKVRAVTVMLSAIRLVEDVFKNDLNAFLKCTVEELFEKTEIVPCSKQLKDSYSILVFPEAYACLRPLTARRRIPLGMSLMVDIGGGTTDMSFFTIENGNAQIYRFISIAKGLNYLSEVDGDTANSKDPAAIKESDLNQYRKLQYSGAVAGRIKNLISDIYDEFQKACSLPKERLDSALKDRPIIFTGGGSTFSSLLQRYENFSDIHQVSVATWNITCFPDFEKTGLCPILNTAYGLSISTGATNDEIAITPFDTIFEGLQGATLNPNPKPRINLRDGTVDTTGCDIVASSEPVVWKLFHVVTETQAARTTEKPDNIQRVRSSEINIADYLAHKVNTQAQSKPHKLEHTQEDVDEYLMLNYEYHIPISDRLRDLYAANIPDERVKASFIQRCAELMKECELYEEQQRQDEETRRNFVAQGNGVIRQNEPKKPRQRIHVSTSQPIEYAIGDKVKFLDEKGGGIVMNVNKTDQTLEIEIEEGFVIAMPWSKCMKCQGNGKPYFKEPKKTQSAPAPVVSQKTKAEKQQEKEEKEYQAGIAALMDKFNKKK